VCRKIRVLTVDDDKLLRMSIQMLLEEQGYEVDAVPSVSEAMASLERCRYEVVLTDLRLPDGDGLDVARHARRLDPRAKVLLMTASPEDLDEDLARGAGVIDVLHKSGELSVLVEETLAAAEKGDILL
jgi:two-component system response regulator PilR (NtrC family)